MTDKQAGADSVHVDEEENCAAVYGENQEANANLIALAPYLLETLKDIEVLTRRQDAISKGTYITETELLEGISQYAKIAIAKAEATNEKANSSRN